MVILNYRKIFYIISALLVGFSLFSIFYKGLPLGIEFTGGSLLEVRYPAEDQGNATSTDATTTTSSSVASASSGQRPSVERVRVALPEGEKFDRAMIQPTGESGYIIRTKELDNEDRQVLLEALSLGGEREVVEDQFTFIGPTIGQELRTKAIYALGGVVAAIILFIAFAFRHVSRPISSWKYGFVAIAALFHDVIIPAGIFAFLGLALGFEVDVLFVIAILTILGYSVNDTIVVFDRVRENLSLEQEKEQENPETYEPEAFETTVGRSLRQTFVRSANTSITTLIVALVLYFVGAESTQQFALVLAIGIIVGTYSSLFFATPLLVTLEKFQKKREANKPKEETEESDTSP